MNPRLVPLLLPAAVLVVIVWALIDTVDRPLQEMTTVLLLAGAGALVIAHLLVVYARK